MYQFQNTFHNGIYQCSWCYIYLYSTLYWRISTLRNIITLVIRSREIQSVWNTTKLLWLQPETEPLHSWIAFYFLVHAFQPLKPYGYDPGRRLRSEKSAPIASWHVYDLFVCWRFHCWNPCMSQMINGARNYRATSLLLTPYHDLV